MLICRLQSIRPVSLPNESPIGCNLRCIWQGPSQQLLTAAWPPTHDTAACPPRVNSAQRVNLNHIPPCYGQQQWRKLLLLTGRSIVMRGQHSHCWQRMHPHSSPTIKATIAPYRTAAAAVAPGGQQPAAHRVDDILPRDITAA
jgi:hypothetical protein